MHRLSAILLCMVCCVTEASFAQRIRIPRRHDKPPGPALSPEEAVKKMTVPDGFTVEIVAAEPNVVNPVAMTIDERGQFWICESLEYPRRSPGKGRDRVKILEDTDGDGKADKFTLFAEGLNIPSGIAVGHGGVWVANSPDILFLQDTDGDGKADKQEVVVTGFGRTDTHELPNSLTWGPDGWLYGLNGVFNYSHVRYAKENPNYDEKHPGWQFTCAMFRIHPRTREFQVFAEGTSNPWGIAFNADGEAFISACVIDHLWHITETGYYHRQGGPYPPHTWKIESIVEHTHQKAAYCGLEYFDSDAYPEKYRGLLYMGNIHGGCINVDKLQRRGSTYFATPEPDFLTANDAWFMPVVQKTGPDGCLYILDWYDRYHCYQDANADPEGIDRLHGRLYRVRYKDTPREWDFDLSKEHDAILFSELHNDNVYWRSTAQRLLSERADPTTKIPLMALVLNDEMLLRSRMYGLWALAGMGRLESDFHLKLLNHKHPALRAWGVRLAGNYKETDRRITEKLATMSGDESRDVQLQLAIAAAKLDVVPTIGSLLSVQAHCGDDPLIPHIVWQNLHPLIARERQSYVDATAEFRRKGVAISDEILSRSVEVLLDASGDDVGAVVEMFGLLIEAEPPNHEAARRCLSLLAERVQSGELKGRRLRTIRERFGPALTNAVADPDHPLFEPAAFLLTSWRDLAGLVLVRRIVGNNASDHQQRLAALDALVAARDPEVPRLVAGVLARTPEPEEIEFKGRMIASLGRLDSPDVARILLNSYPSLQPELQPRVIELLTQRLAWSKRLLDAIGEKQVPANALNLNQVRRLLAIGDKQLTEQVHAKWGTIRDGRDPAREQKIAEMKQFLRKHPGDPFAGAEAYKRVCGQCHKIYGEGAEVGPDITLNGRNSFEQLLSNVFDPSLVIGAAYRAHTLVTTEGRVLTGLVAEDTPQRVVLKVQGGKLETIARDDIEIFKSSEISMMPEDLEKQLKPEEIADLFAFLTLDRHPKDPNAQQLPGIREVEPRETADPKQFVSILAEVAPGFTTNASGEGGVALLSEHMGRSAVVRTHPVGRGQACVLRGKFELPEGKKARLILSVSHHPQGDWQLIAKVNGNELLKTIVGPKTTTQGWSELTVDLSGFAGKTIDVELLNQPNDWANEFGYWGRVVVLTE